MKWIVINVNDVSPDATTESRLVQLRRAHLEQPETPFLQLVLHEKLPRDAKVEGIVLNSEQQPFPDGLVNKSLLHVWEYVESTLPDDAPGQMIRINYALPAKRPSKIREHWNRGDVMRELRMKERAIGKGPEAAAFRDILRMQWREWMVEKASTCSCHMCREGLADDVNLWIDDDLCWDSVLTWMHISHKQSLDKEEFVLGAFETYIEVVGLESWFEHRLRQLYDYAGYRLCFYAYAEVRGFGANFVKDHHRDLLTHEERIEAELVSPLRNATGFHLLPEEMSRTKRCRKFLSEYIEFMADQDPTGHRPRMAKVVKKQVYDDLYKPQIDAEQRRPALGYRHFCTIWDEDHGQVLMTNKKKFAQCPTCWTHTTAWLHSSDTSERNELLLNKNAHLAEVRDARFKVSCLHELALQFPDEFGFLMFDGMDSQKSVFPITGSREVKSVDDLDGYKVKITNVLTHVKNFFFLQDDTVSAGSNSVMTILTRVLDYIWHARGRMFPRKMFLVADSALVNKSSSLATFWAKLTRYRLFSATTWEYLPVGHTHWLNDQTFSKLAQHFAAHDTRILTPRQLEEYLESSVSIASLGGSDESVVEWVERVADFGEFLEPFFYNYVKDRLRFWGAHCWQFMTVRSPFNDDLEVQITQSFYSLTREELIQSHWTEGSRGIFSHRVSQRYFGAHHFSSPVSLACARDQSFMWNQPCQTVAWGMWPKDMSRHRRLVKWEHCTALNWDALQQHLERKGLANHADWIEHIAALKERCTGSCDECNRLDALIAQAKPSRRLKRKGVTAETYKEQAQQCSELQQEKREHLRSEEHVHAEGGFDWMGLLFDKWGGRDWWDPDEDDNVAVLDVDPDVQAQFLNLEENAVGDQLARRCHLFSTPSVLRRMAYRTATESEVDQMAEYDWSAHLSHAKYLVDLRAWDLEDTSSQFHQLTIEEIIDAFWDHCLDVDYEDRGEDRHGGDEFVHPFIDSPEDPYRNTAVLRQDITRPLYCRFLNKSRFLKFQLDGVRVGQLQSESNRYQRQQTEEKKRDESDSNAESTDESDVEQSDESGEDTVMTEQELERKWTDLPRYATRVRPFLDRMNSCELSPEKRLSWMGRCLLLLSPGLVDTLDLNDTLDESRRVHRRWWKSTARTRKGRMLNWWHWGAVHVCKPTARASTVVNHLRVFYFAGSDDNFVYGHFLRNQFSVRKGCVDFVLKHIFIGERAGNVESIPWIGNLSVLIRERFIDQYTPVRIHLNQWNNYFAMGDPFDLIPVWIQKSIKVPVFGVPLYAVVDLRKKFGWKFVHVVTRT